MRSSKKKFMFLVALLVVGASVGAWQWLAGADPEGPDIPATAKVTRRDVSSTVLATGVVRPQIGAEVKVGARISGRVERLNVNIGDRLCVRPIFRKPRPVWRRFRANAPRRSPVPKLLSRPAGQRFDWQK